MKGSMKKLFAVILALVLTVTGIGLDLIVGNKGANEVQAATTDTYKKIGFTDYGIFERTEFTNSSFETPLGTQSTEALTNVEFEGIINIPENQQVAFWFGGTKRTNGVSLQILPGGGANFGWAVNGTDDVKQYVNRPDVAGSYQTAYPLQGHDIILNVKLTPKAVSDTTSDVDVTVTMTKRETMETFYSLSFTKTGITTSVLAPNLFIWPVSGKMTLEPMDWEFEQMGFLDYGYSARTQYSAGLNVPIGGLREDALTNVEFEGIINFPTGKAVALWFGGTSRMDGTCLNIGADGKSMVTWAVNGTDKVKQYINQSGGPTVELQGKDLILNMKLAPKKVSETTSDVFVKITLTDRTAMQTIYTISYTQTGVTTSVLAPNLFIWTVTSGSTVAIEPMDEWTVLDMKDFGIPTGTSASTQIKDLDGTMDMVKIEATLNIPNTLSGEVGPHIAGIIGFQNNGAGQALWIRTLGGSSGFGNLASIGYTYNADVDWELYFWYEDGTDDSEDTVYLRMALYLDGKYIGTYKTGKEERAIDILRRVQIPAQVTVVYDGAALTVGGEGTKTDAIDVMVEQGDALPTGYIADGKYILGWTADGAVVTDYDKTKSNYVAEFVDTKMLTVKQQNNGKTPKDVRFIGSLNTLTGYDEAGFVFANRKVSGQLTIDNGARVQLNTAYVALNAAGQSVTPAQTYDAYSNYFFAYALKEIPVGQTIYARAYVRIGDTIIYGATSEFVIDTLN